MLRRRTLMFITALVSCFGILAAVSLVAAQNEPAKKFTETITTKNGEKISFDMVLIPTGNFLMGSPAKEPGHKNDEEPQHEVHLDSFYLCTTETTIELFMAYYEETMSAKSDLITTQDEEKQSEKIDKVDAITGPTPVYGDMTMGYENNHPAMGMTWYNAMTFCRWLSLKTSKEYRLPTEAEWEYACRAGTTCTFGVGNDPEKLKEYAWYDATADSETSAVGKKKSNVWGLYDMLGNVREWVYDFYSPDTYKQEAAKTPAINPKGPKSGKVHVARGGDFNSPPKELRCAARAYEEKWWRAGDPQIPKSKWWLPDIDIIGFRVACSVEKDK